MSPASNNATHFLSQIRDNNGRFFGELTTFIALGNLWEGLQPDQTF
jgi:hypothetical protein